MTLCRNKLMAEGKPYPRSGCQQCGHGIGRPSVCNEPDFKVPLGDDPKYYVPTSPTVTTRDKYAVIVKESIYIPGDERSRTNPGHGYPAHTETYEKIHVFDDADALKDWVRRNERASFKAIKFQELSVSTEVVVDLK